LKLHAPRKISRSAAPFQLFNSLYFPNINFRVQIPINPFPIIPLFIEWRIPSEPTPSKRNEEPIPIFRRTMVGTTAILLLRAMTIMLFVPRSPAQSLASASGPRSGQVRQKVAARYSRFCKLDWRPGFAESSNSSNRQHWQQKAQTRQ
jgi:hypothetical protein